MKSVFHWENETFLSHFFIKMSHVQQNKNEIKNKTKSKFLKVGL